MVTGLMDKLLAKKRHQNTVGLYTTISQFASTADARQTPISGSKQKNRLTKISVIKPTHPAASDKLAFV